MMLFKIYSPSACLLGGLNTVSRPLVALLVPLEGDRLVGVSPIAQRRCIDGLTNCFV
jgi:hypothetical protein